MSRYDRQLLLPQLGATGQERLRAARVLLVGCGALGTHLADQLVRAGIGFLRIADRDIVELSNLHRQTLFDESDAREGMPKAIAAARRLRAINSEVSIEPHAIDVASDNILQLMGDVDVTVDGTDNVGTRYLINDAAVKLRRPWVYGACVGVEGRVMAVMPGESACLRCLFRHPPAAHELPTCDTAGVLGSVAAMVASFQAVAAIQVIFGRGHEAAGCLLALDGWKMSVRRLQAMERSGDCPCCVRGEYEFLESVPWTGAVLCGRAAVQVRPAAGRSLNMAGLANRLSKVGSVRQAGTFVRCELADSGLILTVFPDGRAIVQGTSELARARSVYARYIGD